MKKHIFSYRIEELTPFIDWSYLLHAWGIKHMEHAGEVIHDAKLMLYEIKEREVAKGGVKGDYALETRVWQLQ